jgi:DNA repair protein RadC
LPAVDRNPQAAAMLDAVRQCHLALLSAPSHRGEPQTGISVVAYFQAAIGRDGAESFHAMFLDGSNRLIARELVNRGSVDQCLVDPSQIVLRALDLGARRLIVAHNHPSGDPTPSPSDIALTRKLANACHLFDITLVDHLVIASDGFASFHAKGLL